MTGLLIAIPLVIAVICVAETFRCLIERKP